MPGTTRRKGCAYVGYLPDNACCKGGKVRFCCRVRPRRLPRLNSFRDLWARSEILAARRKGKAIAATLRWE
jgi:hypothetical protein